MAATTTLSTLRTRVYNILNQDEDTKNYPYTLIDGLINNSQRVLLNTNPYDPRGDRQETSPKFTFLDTDQFFESVADNTLDGDAVVGAVTLDISAATDFPTAGTLWVGGNIITYTGITSNQLTGVPASGDGSIALAHDSGLSVSLLYDMPTNFGYAEEFIYNNSLPMLFKDYGNLRKHFRATRGGNNYNRNLSSVNSLNSFTTQPFYTIIHGLHILVVNISNTGRPLQLRYQKTPTDMSDGSDTSVIPNEFAVDTIPYFAAADVYFNRDDALNAEKIRMQAIGKIKEMYDYYKKVSKESSQFNRIPTGKDSNYNY